MSMMDSLQKAQGVLTASLFTALGSYYTLKSLLGAILELFVEMLIVLVSIIVGLWVLPFTWPAAGVMTAVFVAIAIPLSIIIAVMTEVLHISSSGIPKLKCFDENTKLIVDNKIIFIKNINLGDLIGKNNKILGKIKLMSENEDFYNYKNIIISGTHKVLEDNKWIFIKDSVLSIKIDNYNKKFIFCLITEQKKIEINNNQFLDWDEIINNNNNNNLVYGGFSNNCQLKLFDGENKIISLLQPGDILENGEIVYGTIELDPSILYTKQYFRTNIGHLSYCYTNNLNSIFINKYNQCFVDKNICTSSKLYHLLTSTGYFYIGNNKFRDYNYMSEHVDTLK
jgi:hypothetical protein